MNPPYRRHRAKKDALINARKAEGCQICRYHGHYSTLDLHHVDPKTKKFRVASLSRGTSMSGLLEEIAKCIVLCANCHRNVHANEIILKPHPKRRCVTIALKYGN